MLELSTLLCPKSMPFENEKLSQSARKKRTLLKPPRVIQKHENLDLVRFVLLANSKGLYGGPTDTAAAQHLLTSELNQVVLAGSFEGDSPAYRDVNLVTFKVRHLFGLKSYFDIGSIRMIPILWGYSKAKCVHISFARGLSTFLFTFFCLIHRTPILLQTHGMLTSRTSAFHKMLDFFITKRLCERSDRILALTSVEAEALIVWHSRLAPIIKVLGNPSNTYRPLVEYEPTNSVLFAARLHPRKRVSDFIEAARFSSSQGSQVEYKILGPDEGDLAIVLKGVEELPNLNYLGSTSSDGVLEELSRSKVFALTSQDEPWGNVLVSALAMGKPVVLTESSHLATLIAEAGAGIVVPDHDSSALANSINYLLEPKIYAIFAKEAKKLHLSHFTNENVKAELLEAYKDLSMTADVA